MNCIANCWCSGALTVVLHGQVIVCVDKEVVVASPVLVVMHNGCQQGGQMGASVHVARGQATPGDEHMNALQHIGCMAAVVIRVVGAITCFYALQEPH